MQLLRVAIERARSSGASVKLVDIAAGHGRYVLDALAQAGVQAKDHVALRDYCPVNVAAGQALINAQGLGAQVTFEAGDAFDRNALATLEPQPTIAVVSGLYELFADNGLLKESLAGLAQGLAPGGFLLYTNQPWHPQLEFIARVLTSHRQGTDWVMRRRTQLEMDELVRAAGFTKITQIADRWGIFTVSLAVKA